MKCLVASICGGCLSKPDRHGSFLYESQTFAQHAAVRINKAAASTINILTPRRNLCKSVFNVRKAS
jgi:hypothetical protein